MVTPSYLELQSVQETIKLQNLSACNTLEQSYEQKFGYLTLKHHSKLKCSK